MAPTLRAQISQRVKPPKWLLDFGVTNQPGRLQSVRIRTGHNWSRGATLPIRGGRASSIQMLMCLSGLGLP